jgi:hypothetical protein
MEPRARWLLAGVLLPAVGILVGLLAWLFPRAAREEPAETSRPDTVTSVTRPGEQAPERREEPPTSGSTVAPAAPARRFTARLARTTGVDLANGSLLYAIAGTPSLEACQRVIQAASGGVRWIGLQNVAPGSTMCVETGQGRTAAVTALARSDRSYSSASLTIEALVWT